MYNRILKRPMFRRGGMGYSAQGSGITSGMDTPRPRYYGGGTIGGGMIHGNPMGYRTGFDDPVLRPKEEIRGEMEAVFETPKGTWLDDVIGSFGAYSTPYKADGTAKTIGEMGAEQAASITQIRKDRKDKQDLAKLSSLEGELADVTAADAAALKQKNELAILKQKHDYNKAITEMEGENLEFKQQIKWERKNADDKIAALDPDSPTYEQDKAAIEAEFQNASKNIVRNNPSLQRLIGDAKKSLFDIHEAEMKSTGSSFIVTAMEQWNAKNPTDKKTLLDIINELAVADVTGTTAAASILIQSKATGGRVGYQMGTPNTGAMPVQQASLTETIDTPGADMTATETITEQQPTVQMPYEEFRAAIPPEVNDAIVQLIYYNQDAFADFSQITTQSEVYAFNNKYGVSLVLPMDTETT
jgi:hypothetical protein